MDVHENEGALLSECCRSPCRAVITDAGKWELYCEKCLRRCSVQEEKYSIDSKLLPF